MSRIKRNVKPAQEEPASQSAIRTGLFLRSLALLRLSMSVGSGHAGNKIVAWLNTERNAEEQLRGRLMTQARAIAYELGLLKGSVMKVGQMLSCYGERFLAPEVNVILKQLQAQAPPLEWNTIRPIIERELGAEKFGRLEIDPVAIASASIGQVHSARIRSTQERIAVKVQYPGVDKAIDSDLKTLKSMLKLAQLIPQAPLLDGILFEVREMLIQELDYGVEADFTEKFHDLLSDSTTLEVPQVYREFSSGRILTTAFAESHAIDSLEVLSLPPERRERLARAALELYFREIFEFRMVQTDPHFGNYRVRIANDGPCNDRLVLLDFGAVRCFDEAFVSEYRKLTTAALEGHSEAICEAATRLGFLRADDPNNLKSEFSNFCQLVVEPFNPTRAPQEIQHLFTCNGGYDWTNSDLPSRLSAQLKSVIRAHELRAPPREMFFLDRKVSGLFVLLGHLGVRVEGRSLLDQHLNT